MQSYGMLPVRIKSQQHSNLCQCAGSGHFLVHARLDFLCGDFVLLNDVHDGSPTGGCVAVEGVDEGLSDALKQLIRIHLGLPQSFAHTEKLFLAGAGNGEVWRLCHASDEVHGADVGLGGVGVKTRHNRVDEEWSKSSLVQHVRQDGGERLGRHVAALRELVHVLAELHLLLDGLDVGG